MYVHTLLRPHTLQRGTVGISPYLALWKYGPLLYRKSGWAIVGQLQIGAGCCLRLTWAYRRCVYFVYTHLTPSTERERERAKGTRHTPSSEAKGGGGAISDLDLVPYLQFLAMRSTLPPLRRNRWRFLLPPPNMPMYSTPSAKVWLLRLLVNEGRGPPPGPFSLINLLFSSGQGKSQPLSLSPTKKPSLATNTDFPTIQASARALFFCILPVKRTLSRRKGAEAAPRGHGCTFLHA